MVDLSRTLGLKEATALGVGAMVGAGIFVLSAVAVRMAGPAAIIAFLTAAVLQLLFGLCYAELVARRACTGGSYEYVRIILGRFPGAVAGWSYWGAWIIASSFVSMGFGYYLNELTGYSPIVSAVGLLLVLGGINIAGVIISGRLQVAVVVMVIVLITSFSVLGVSHVDISSMVPFVPFGIAGILAAVPICFLSMLGWDGIIAAGGEIKTPERTIPPAIFFAITLVLVLYLSMVFVSIGVVSWQEFGASPVPISFASEQFLGSIGPVAVTIAVLLALIATANAFIMTISRTAFAMGRSGLLPHCIAKIHPRLGTPVPAILLGVAMQILSTLISGIEVSATATGFLYILSYLMTIVALIVLRRSPQRATRHFQLPAHPLIPTVALICGTALLTQVGIKGSFMALSWIAVGIVVFILRYKNISQDNVGHGDATN